MVIIQARIAAFYDGPPVVTLESLIGPALFSTLHRAERRHRVPLAA